MSRPTTPELNSSESDPNNETTVFKMSDTDHEENKIDDELGGSDTTLSNSSLRRAADVLKSVGRIEPVDETKVDGLYDALYEAKAALQGCNPKDLKSMMRAEQAAMYIAKATEKESASNDAEEINILAQELVGLLPTDDENIDSHIDEIEDDDNEDTNDSEPAEPHEGAKEDDTDMTSEISSDIDPPTETNDPKSTVETTDHTKIANLMQYMIHSIHNLQVTVNNVNSKLDEQSIHIAQICERMHLLGEEHNIINKNVEEFTKEQKRHIMEVKNEMRDISSDMGNIKALLADNAIESTTLKGTDYTAPIKKSTDKGGNSSGVSKIQTVITGWFKDTGFLNDMLEALLSLVDKNTDFEKILQVKGLSKEKLFGKNIPPMSNADTLKWIGAHSAQVLANWKVFRSEDISDRVPIDNKPSGSSTKSMLKKSKPVPEDSNLITRVGKVAISAKKNSKFESLSVYKESK